MRSLQCLFLIVFTEARRFQKPTRYGSPGPESSFVPSQNDDMPSVPDIPVPFGHIYKDGFGDPSVNGKSPIDILEWTMKSPKNNEEAKEWLKTANPDDIEFYKSTYPQTPKVLNARDKFLAGISDTLASKNESNLKWFDLADLQARNIASPNTPRRPFEPNNRLKEAVESPAQIGEFLMPGRIDPMIIGRNKSIKFTTCDEFGSRAYFYPKDIVNFNWVPFYIWSSREYDRAIVHKFTYATKKLVIKYRAIYQNNKLIDWDQPKLMMKGMNDFLLIAADQKGLFHAVSLVELPDIYPKDYILPYSSFRLKIDDPYLLMMICEDQFATAMAVEGHEPSTDKEKQIEADSLNFIGPGRPVSRNIREEKLALKAQREMEERLKVTGKAKEEDNTPQFVEPEQIGVSGGIL